MVLAQPCPTHAEPYAAGFAGYGLSAQIADVRTDGSTGSNLRLQNSPIFGLKVGYFLDRLKYLGGEAELYTATPYLKQQQFTQNSPGGTQTGITSGDHIRATTAAFNVVFRYPGRVIQPYAGIGLGLFLFSDPTSTEDAPLRLGVNVLAGTRVFVTNQMALFGEYKYNHTTFPADDFKANYNAHFIVFGVGWHF